MLCAAYSVLIPTQEHLNDESDSYRDMVATVSAAALLRSTLRA